MGSRVTPESWLPSQGKGCEVRPPLVQHLKERPQPRSNGRLGKVLHGIGLAAPRAETHVHAKLKVQTQEVGRLGQAKGFIPADQGLRRGHVAVALLLAEPISAPGFEVEPDRPSPALHELQHPAGLGPAPIDEEDVGRPRFVGWGDEAVGWLAARMEDPWGPVHRAREAQRVVACQAPVENRDPAAGDDPSDKAARARRTPLLASMLEDMDAHRCFDRGQGMADAPTRWKLAAVTPFGARKDDAARHARSMGGSGARGNAEPRRPRRLTTSGDAAGTGTSPPHGSCAGHRRTRSPSGPPCPSSRSAVASARTRARPIRPGPPRRRAHVPP